jgi:apolipoprotein D and lipocalin family protein
LNYLWILSRTNTIPEDVKNHYLQIAEDAGYDTSELLWVEHDD